MGGVKWDRNLAERRGLAPVPEPAQHDSDSWAAGGEEARFRHLLEELPVAVYTTDAAGWITFFNRAAVAFAGREPQLGRDRWCVTHRLFWPDGTPLPQDQCPMAIALRERRPIRGVDVIAERPDGTRIPFIPYPTPIFDGEGVLIGAVNMLVDITERKRAETALQQLNETLEQGIEERTRQVAETFAKLHESERRFRLLVQGVTDYAIYMLDPDGIVTNWNSGAERIKGYAAGEIIGRHFSCFYTEEDRQRGVPQRVLATALRTGKYEAEGWRVRKSGERFWASVVLDAIHDETGTHIGFAKITRDLTEKRAADDQLRQAQKMEAVGQLTGGVAHDFNNLLTAIIGNLDMIAAQVPPDGRVSRHVEAARRAAWRGSKLTEHLLAFSRRREVSASIVDVNRLLRDLSVLCQKTVGEGVELVLRLESKLWLCRLDVTQFEAALLNLAANARDAMARAGQLAITTENVTVGLADGPDLRTGDYVVVSVTDSGCGMSADVVSHAFEPFFTTKEVGKGTGLGLSQVYGFAKQSGGTARIESKAGIGTTVRLYMPRAEGQAVVADPAGSAVLGEAPKGSGTILVVEDDEAVRDIVERMLAHLGYQTLLAGSGPEALVLLRREPAIDVLFSDIIMPAGMNGIELARLARQMRPGLKVLLCSGYPGDEIKLRELKEEFAFIQKPYLPAALGRKLYQVLGLAPAPAAEPDAATPLILRAGRKVFD
jgi:PAS domain S-box-containing protein